MDIGGQVIAVIGGVISLTAGLLAAFREWNQRRRASEPDLLHDLRTALHRGTVVCDSNVITILASDETPAGQFILDGDASLIERLDRVAKQTGGNTNAVMNILAEGSAVLSIKLPVAETTHEPAGFRLSRRFLPDELARFSDEMAAVLEDARDDAAEHPGQAAKKSDTTETLSMAWTVFKTQVLKVQLTRKKSQR